MVNIVSMVCMVSTVNMVNVARKGAMLLQRQSCLGKEQVAVPNATELQEAPATAMLALSRWERLPKPPAATATHVRNVHIA